MNRLGKAQFAAIACDYLFDTESNHIESWMKDNLQKGMNREEVLAQCSNHIMWSVHHYYYGIRETKKFFWDMYKEFFR